MSQGLFALTQMQTNCILEGEGQCVLKLYRIASCGRGQNSTDTKQGSGQTTSARGMVGVVDVTTVQEYTQGQHTGFTQLI